MVLPEFGSVTNPIDGTGAMFDDLELLPKLMSVILGNGGRSIIAASVSARPDNFNERQRHLARSYAEATRAVRTVDRCLSADSARKSGSGDVADFQEGGRSFPAWVWHRDAER